MPIRSRLAVCLLVLPALLCACSSQHIAATTQPALAFDTLADPTPDPDVQAILSPPVGWKAKPLEVADRSRHRVWVSPTGDTAFGAIFVKLPLPVGPNFALMGFMMEMEKSEGGGKVVEKKWDPQAHALRYIAESPVHTIWAKMETDGFDCWVFYAGTLTGHPVNLPELLTAARAREAAIIGLPAGR